MSFGIVRLRVRIPDILIIIHETGQTCTQILFSRGMFYPGRVLRMLKDSLIGLKIFVKCDRFELYLDLLNFSSILLAHYSLGAIRCS